MSDTFERACAVADVPDEGVVATEVGGVEVAVVKSEGQYFAVRDECSHAQIQLSEGDVGGCEIECWLHGSRFDLRTGEPTSLPAVRPGAGLSGPRGRRRSAGRRQEPLNQAS